MREPLPDVDLILEAVEASGLSARRFAERILSRDERTIRRWSAGEVPIPPQARAYLELWLELTKKDRRTVVLILAPGDG